MNIDSIAKQGFHGLIKFVIVHHGGIAVLCLLYHMFFGNKSIVISVPVLIVYLVIGLYFGAFVARFQRRKIFKHILQLQKSKDDTTKINVPMSLLSIVTLLVLDVIIIALLLENSAHVISMVIILASNGVIAYLTVKQMPSRWFIEQMKKRIRQRENLFDEPHWEVDAVRDVDIFFLNLPLIFPENTFLCLAEGSYSSEVRSFIDTYHTNESLPHLVSAFHNCDTIAINNETMRLLADLANHHAAPEIAGHVCVCSKTKRLHEWFDFPDDPIAISLDIPEESVRRFCEALGTKYRLEED